MAMPMTQESPEQTKKEYAAFSTLKERGWTKTLVERFLGEPDLEVDNPHHRYGYPMKLYRLERVAEVEQTEEWVQGREKAAKRQQAAAKAVKTKNAKIMQYVEQVSIHVQYMDLEVLADRIINRHNRKQERIAERRRLRGKPRIYLPMLSREAKSSWLLERHLVNHIRHRLTTYENHLDKMFGQTGKALGYPILKKRVLAEIAKVYPDLAKECQRQSSELDSKDATNG